MALLSAQHEELQRLVEKWCRQQQELLHKALPPAQQPHLEASGDVNLLGAASKTSPTPFTGSASDAFEQEQVQISDSTALASAAGVSLHNQVSATMSKGSEMNKACTGQSTSSSKVNFSEDFADFKDKANLRQHSKMSRKSILSYFSGRNFDSTLNDTVRRALTVQGMKHRGKTMIQKIGIGQRRDRTMIQKMGCLRMRSRLSTIIHSGSFESFIAVVITFNAALMSLQANHVMQNPSSPSNPVMHHIEFVLCIIYAVELVLRMFVHGCRYFVDANWIWNWFDMFLVIMSIYDQIVTAVAVENPNAMFNLSFFRMLRLLKMLKLLRVIRLMKFFKELRLILYAVMGGVQAMFWACVLIAIISYVAGILFVQACAQYLQEAKEDTSPASRELIQIYWADVATAMLSLFKACTSGESWTNIARPLQDVGSLWYGIFVAYIAFFAFVIMNTLTSLFVDTVMDHSAKDLQMVIQLELDKKNEYINMLRNFFQAVDSNHNGVLTYQDFQQHLHNPIIQGFAATMEIDIMNAQKFFRVLSHDGTREVDLEAFVVGCIKLKGNARSVDLIEHIYSFKKYVADQTRFTVETALKLQTLERTLKEFHIQAAASPRKERTLKELHIQTAASPREPSPSLQQHSAPLRL